MSTKKLYALSEREAAVLRARDPRWTDSAQRATPDPLTPIDTDAAVERMARALSEHWRDMHTNEALGQQRMLARASLNALLGSEQGGTR